MNHSNKTESMPLGDRGLFFYSTNKIRVEKEKEILIENNPLGSVFFLRNFAR